jgi:signal transduction histidine kinase
MKTHFDPEREAAFRLDYASKSLFSVRFGLLLGAVLYALFAVLDIWMLPESWRSAHWIRFAVVVPVCLGALALTFVERVRGHLQALVSTFVIVGGLGIIAMIALAQESEPASRYYYAGLLLVLTFSFTVVRLRFLPAALCCFVIIATYELVAVWDQGLLADGLRSGAGPVFLNNNFFLVAAGVITLMGSYVLENYARTDFRQRTELAEALEELKATQAQLIQSERTAAMGNVVAGLLHELNSPVGAIASAADVVVRGVGKLKSEAVLEKRELTNALIEDNAYVLRSATQRVRQTLEVLKRFSHLDKAETADYDVNGALADCLTLLAHESGSRIVVEQHLGEIPKIRCRPAEINQLFMSLLKNAIQAIPHTGVIEVRTCAQNGSVRIDIVDTGVGIAEDRLKDLFVPKFSQDRSRVKLGLGLMTSHNIVQRHGGAIDIESRVGKGTRVSVTLPFKG